MSVQSPPEAMQTITNLRKSLDRKTLDVLYGIHIVNLA